MNNLFKCTLLACAIFALPLTAQAEGEIIRQETSQKTYTILHQNRALPALQVKVLQEALAQKGFFKGKADGVWGGKTDVAIKSWQKSAGLEPSGVLNTPDLEALGVYISATDATTDLNAAAAGMDVVETRNEYEIHTLKKVDMVTDGNGPKARGAQAFKE